MRKFGVRWDKDRNDLILHSIKDEIARPIAYIINLSMCQGIFPDKLKTTVIKPLFKKGSKLDVSNYRPIALLSPFSKVSEKVYLKRVLSFLSKNTVISENKFGYRKGSSCIDATIRLNDMIAQCKSEKSIALTIFLDLSKAFDCVSHATLLSIIERYGIRGVALDLLKSYLSNRTQAVSVPSRDLSGTQLSDFKQVRDGVPQGSVYGPYLFILYINCLHLLLKNFECDCILYVDDTNLIIIGKSMACIREKALQVLQAVYDFFSALHLALNLEKTNYIIFNHAQIDLDLHINNVKIQPSSSSKFLGMIVDHKLSWKQHIKGLLKKILKGIFVLKQTAVSLGKKHNLMVFNAFIQSHLSYGILLWCGSSRNKLLIESVFRKQKRALRLLNGVKDQKTSCRGMFKKDNLMTLAGLFIYSASIHARKHLSTLTCSSVHSHNTRNSENLFVKKFVKGDVSLKCVQVFNKLPTYVKQAPSMSSFKIKLKHYIIEREPYDIQEFVE